MKSINELKKENRELKKELTRLQKIAYSDIKFNCKNRNYLECNRKSFDNKEIIVVMNDLNGLKKINDIKGHDSGDSYIRKFIIMAKNYFDNLEIKNQIVRLGGDEFLILIFNRFELFNIEYYTKMLDNIASCGSTYKPKETRLYFALKKADKILYNNKQDFYKNKQIIYKIFVKSLFHE